MEKLNDEQRRAVEVGDGPVAVIAGPGTGKTKTLVARIEHLIKSSLAAPGEILALTFTKKAAEEMQERLNANVKVRTFHGICFEILNEPKPFVSDVERLSVIKNLEKPKSLKHLSVREIGLLISRAKNSTGDPTGDIGKVVRAYNQELAEQGMRDFDDLLLEAWELLKEHSKSLPWRYILVDEFQDTNLLQYEILKLLSSNDNLFVIGDPNQSIYGFRGASGSIFERFKKEYKKFKEITLHVNYRSVPEVVELANAIISSSADLKADSKTTGQVRAVEVLNEYGEAHWVISEIQKAIGGGDLLKAVSDDARSGQRRLGDFAVLYRSRSAAITLQKMMDESGLPYQVVGDGSPYEKPQVQAILALMRESLNGVESNLQGYGSAQRRLLKAGLEKVADATPLALAEELIAILGFPASRDLKQFGSVLARFKTVKSALAYFDKIAEQGFYDPAADAITLLTIHASKGLEFARIFLVGVEEGILPSERGDESEEKRLFYVAVTRARERLEITHARNRGGQAAEVSRFVAQLNPKILPRLIDPSIPNQLKRIQKRALKRSQTQLF